MAVAASLMQQTLTFDSPIPWAFKRCGVCKVALTVEPARPQVTYAIKRQRWVKIGSTGNLPERLGVLRRASEGCITVHPPQMDWRASLRLLVVIDGYVEHELHDRFASCHAAGEWFLPDADLAEWIRRHRLSREGGG